MNLSSLEVEIPVLCIVFISDSETAFCLFEKLLLIICVCFVVIVFFRVRLFDLIYPIVRLCGGVITRSCLLFFLKQLCILIGLFTAQIISWHKV